MTQAASSATPAATISTPARKPGVPFPAEAIEPEDGPRHVAGNDAGEQDCPEQTAEPEHASILRFPGERRCAEGYPGALETCHSRGVCPAQHAKRSKRVPAARLAGAAFHLEVHRTRMRVLERPAPEVVALVPHQIRLRNQSTLGSSVMSLVASGFSRKAVAVVSLNGALHAAFRLKPEATRARVNLTPSTTPRHRRAPRGASAHRRRQRRRPSAAPPHRRASADRAG